MKHGTVWVWIWSCLVLRGKNRKISSCCFFSWPLVRELCMNYEVVVLYPWTGNSLYLVSVSYSYSDILLSTTPPFPPATQCPPGGGYPLMTLPYLPCRPLCLHIGSFVHPIVTCLRPSILSPIDPYISNTSLPSLILPCLPYSQLCALASAKIYSNIALSSF